MRKPVKSWRIDGELADRARAAGLNVPDIIEAALAAALKEKQCPYCRQSIKRRATDFR